MTDKTKYKAKLRGSRVLVVGGSAGIGYAVAEAAIEHGCQMTISSSNLNRVEEGIDSLIKSYPSAEGRIFGYTCDMSDESFLEDNIVKLLQSTGELDHIVYTAGDSVPPTPIAGAKLEKMKQAETVRYTGPLFLAKHASKYLEPSLGSLVTLTTGVIIGKPISGWSVIAGPRAAVVGLGRNLALDLKPVRVNVVSVGAVDTDTWSALNPEAKQATFKSLIAKSTTGRIAEPSDVAEAYLYCMKDRNVTGSVISTNGGSLLT